MLRAMKHIALALSALALAACTPAAPPEATTEAAATSTEAPSALGQKIAGCWHEQVGGEISDVQWTVDLANSTRLTALNNVIIGNGHGRETYTLAAEGGGWIFCETSAGQNECRGVAEGEPRGADQALIVVTDTTLQMIEPTTDGDRIIVEAATRTECPSVP